jgi:hypothetical protein
MLSVGRFLLKSQPRRLAEWKGRYLHGWVAQLAEQRTENPRVGGSIPPPAIPFFIGKHEGKLRFFPEPGRNAGNERKHRVTERKVSCSVMQITRMARAVRQRPPESF